MHIATNQVPLTLLVAQINPWIVLEAGWGILWILEFREYPSPWYFYIYTCIKPAHGFHNLTGKYLEKKSSLGGWVPHIPCSYPKLDSKLLGLKRSCAENAGYQALIRQVASFNIVWLPTGEVSTFGSNLTNYFGWAGIGDYAHAASMLTVLRTQVPLAIT